MANSSEVGLAANNGNITLVNGIIVQSGEGCAVSVTGGTLGINDGATCKNSSSTNKSSVVWANSNAVITLNGGFVNQSAGFAAGFSLNQSGSTAPELTLKRGSVMAKNTIGYRRWLFNKTYTRRREANIRDTYVWC